MGTLLRASEFKKRPVVTLGGEAIGQVRDLIYGVGGGEIAAIGVGSRGLLSGGVKWALPWSSVIGVGPDAVMIPAENVLVDIDSFMGSLGVGANAAVVDVVGSEVLTEDGAALGKVIDIIIGVGGGRAQPDVAGYEIEVPAAGEQRAHAVLIPLPDALSVSRQNLVVPTAVRSFMTNDLASFEQAVAEFRRQSAGGQ